MNTTFEEIVFFIQSIFGKGKDIQLHEPTFRGKEKEYVNEAINSTYVSSMGPFVDKFEQKFADFTKSKYAISTMNGTAALHIALKLSNVNKDDEVLTQPLTFVATVNAITYCNARPIFIDIDKDTLSLSPKKLKEWLDKNAITRNKACYNKKTKKIIRACVPMHTYGQVAHINEIKEICDQYNITLIEDAAEAVGSYTNGNHAGTFGKLGIYSFNGNKIITSGGGGMITTNDKSLALRAKELTTTSRKISNYEYYHDEVSFNYRLPNINAALGCAQLEQIEFFLERKRKLAKKYQNFFSSLGINFLTERKSTQSNFWLNTIVFKNENDKSRFLSYSNKLNIHTRPAWRLMNKIKPYSRCQKSKLINAEYFSKRLVNLPSSVI